MHMARQKIPQCWGLCSSWGMVITCETVWYVPYHTTLAWRIHASAGGGGVAAVMNIQYQAVTSTTLSCRAGAFCYLRPPANRRTNLISLCVGF